MIQVHIVGPSAHLTWPELACHDRLRTGYPIDWRATRAIRLAAVFEAVRAAAGGVPIAIRSAYRTLTYNASIGGAPQSQHCEGRALDLTPPPGFTPIAFFLLVYELATEHIGDIKGLGLYSTFVHLDIRPAPALVTWRETPEGMVPMTAAYIHSLRPEEASA